MITIQNRTGAAIAERSILEVSTPVLTIATELNKNQERPTFEGIAPTATTSIVCVSEGPLAADAYGRAVLLGAAVVELNVVSITHGYCGPAVGVTARLTTAASGPIRILPGQDPGTGNKKAMVLSPAAEQELGAYPWPGNVRELQNCIERAVILSEGDTLHPRHLNLLPRGPALPSSEDRDASPWSKIDLSGTLAQASRRALGEVERRKIEQALTEAGGSRGRAAEILQVSFKVLLLKLKEHGLD